MPMSWWRNGPNELVAQWTVGLRILFLGVFITIEGVSFSVFSFIML